MSGLDSKRTKAKVAKATKLAKKALEPYGEPDMTLDELRVIVTRQLKGVSLSDLVIEERQKGW